MTVEKLKSLIIVEVMVPNGKALMSPKTRSQVVGAFEELCRENKNLAANLKAARLRIRELVETITFPNGSTVRVGQTDSVIARKKKKGKQ